ncbi:MAG: acyl--CoA ligase [Alphaproteobacteria bacterium]|nr:acyl--CoA ligase [Alphaproteobacteria bacterium]
MNMSNNEDEIEYFTNQDIWGDVSIDLAFREKAQNHRSSIGLSGYSVCDDQFSELSYAHIQAVVDKIALQLLFFGLKAGDVMAVQLPNSIETQILYLACWQKGIVVAPLPALWREYDVKQALIRISPEAYICPILHDGFNYTDLMYQIGFDISSIKLLFSVGGNPIDGCISLDEFFAHRPTHDVNLLKPDDYPVVDANSTCLISFAKDDNDKEAPFYHSHNQLIAATKIFNSLAKPVLKNQITSPFPPTSMAVCALTIISWVLSDAKLTCYDGLMATEFQNIDIKDAIIYLPAAFDEPKLIEALFEQGLNKLVFIDKINAPAARRQIRNNILDVTVLGEYAFIPQLRNALDTQIQAKTYKYRLVNNVKDEVVLGQYRDHTQQKKWQISCSFLPTNIVKTEGKFNSNIEYATRSTNQKLDVGNMTLSYADIERELLGFHGVEDAAVLAIQDKLLGHRPVIAIVPKVGAVILHHELVEFLKNKQIAAYKIPHELYKIPNIPCDHNNNIIRLTSKQALLKLVGPQKTGGGDGLLAVQQELAALLADSG